MTVCRHSMAMWEEFTKSPVITPFIIEILLWVWFKVNAFISPNQRNSLDFIKLRNQMQVFDFCKSRK
jgi:hypothetical protein